MLFSVFSILVIIFCLHILVQLSLFDINFMIFIMIILTYCLLYYYLFSSYWKECFRSSYEIFLTIRFDIYSLLCSVVEIISFCPAK